MGGKNSKVDAKAVQEITPAETQAMAAKLEEGAKGQAQYDKYVAFRDELLGFSLGESAYDFAEELYSKNSESPAVMALLAETAVLYDKTKNKVYRDHWCDRLDLLQRGVDVSRKCFNEHPDYGPCYRTYVLAATREAEALYYFTSWQGVGLLENFNAIMRKGERAVELLPKDADVPNALAALCGRSAFPWYHPTRWLAKLHGVPDAKTCRKMSIDWSLKAVENDPGNLEYACRLAQAYFQAGDMVNSRRWYLRVRDEMPPRTLDDSKWQGLAHTQLSTSFVKSQWNVPFA